jgi:hypothetical protein
MGDKRMGLFASHDPDRIGVVVDGLTYSLSGAELLAMLERRGACGVTASDEAQPYGWARTSGMGPKGAPLFVLGDLNPNANGFWGEATYIPLFADGVSGTGHQTFCEHTLMTVPNSQG